MKAVTVPKLSKDVKARLNDFDREIELTRQNKQLSEMLARRAKQTKTVPFKEAKVQLGLD